MVLIDFEYGGWNPAAFDLGNYLTEMALDNAHSFGIGIKYYEANLPTDAEITQISKWYLEGWHRKRGGTDGFESFCAERLAKFEQDVRQCMLLSCWYWGVWALSMLPDDKVCDESLFNVEYAVMRCKLFEHLKKRFIQ